MRLGKTSNLKPGDNYLKNFYLNKITFNNSDILKTKVRAVVFKDKNISITIKLTSPLLSNINKKCLTAFIYNDEDTIKVKIRKKIKIYMKSKYQ